MTFGHFVQSTCKLLNSCVHLDIIRLLSKNGFQPLWKKLRYVFHYFYDPVNTVTFNINGEFVIELSIGDVSGDLQDSGG